MKTTITSESVNKGHPDKTCDIIADAFLDEALKQDPNSQMAVECAIKNDLLMIYGEATTNAVINYELIASEILKELGYKQQFRFIKEISKQSIDITQAVVNQTLKANDQGIVFGYATDETKECMPLSILIAHKLMKQYELFRINNKQDYFADAKSQVSVVYEDDKILKIETVLVSVSHASHVKEEKIKEDILNYVITPILKQYKNFDFGDIQYLINTSGRFTIWGSFCDSGCVGRKIVVDSYGGAFKVGGGCFSSKNATKVDRSGAYFARFIAKNIVANSLANRCEVALSFALGIERPLNIQVDCFNTNKIPMDKIKEIILNNFNFTLSAIIEKLELLNPVYKQTACYGHFGREEFTWEKTFKLNVNL